MKKIRNFNLFLFVVLAILSCDKDELVNLVEPSHRVIVTSEMNFDNTINVGGHIDFGDISQGVESRLWTFPETVSTIVGASGNTSSKDVVKGLFNTPGVYDVTLNQVFKKNVYPNEDSQEPIDGRELDTTIVVTVLGPVEAYIKAHYINDDGTTGEELDLSDNAENELTASKYVRLSYTADGAPEDFVWNLPGAKPDQVAEAEPEVDVRYSKLGSWDLQFIASRNRPGGADTINVKKFIKVVASTEPVTLDRVFEKTKETSIGLEFSREMDPESVNKDDFTVKIETASGAVLNPVIANVSVDNTEGNVLVVELSNEMIYNDDTVKVSYIPGTLRTSDLVDATEIVDAVLTDFIKENLFDDPNFSDVDNSFEKSEVENWPNLPWGAPWNAYDMSFSYDQAHSGEKSMYLEFHPEGGMIIGNVDASGENITFPTEKGFNYEMGAWFYVVDAGVPVISNVRMYWRPSTNWGVPDNPTFSADSPVGEWFYSSAIVNFSADGNESFMLRGQNVNSETLKFYMDDLSLYKLSSRP
ncbi:hypothetical protein [Algibacter mikhailovii]|uniref:Uncharacterized protein n=1 Tax=Algibacter mikhailovii TaxID=425498 RepID=A0A918V4J7_9FLAO|nr:hypothetical protein [Algibacter mikhailovii]GGZ67985.1 hypothetical protein GCM10007028_01130 [Algibacter mikhailovii]